MQSGFRKLSRVGMLAGATKWYLSADCLLAAKRVLYTVEYRRFYLRDIESIVVWPSRIWLLRPIIPGVLLLALGNLLWFSSHPTAGAIFDGIGLAWAALELALGPTAEARIRTTGATVDLPLVKRTRRAGKVLAKIDAAIHAAHGSVIAQAATARTRPQPAAPSVQTSPETTSATAPIGDLT